jgi:DNA-binding FadR family transcriptional regulator
MIMKTDAPVSASPMKASLAVAAEFRERIVRGQLGAGDPLPVEDALMEELDASRSVVRESLRILETEGLIVIRRGVGGGPRVRHPTISETAMAMGVYLQIGDILVTDVWEARDRIIGASVEQLYPCQPAQRPSRGRLQAKLATPGVAGAVPTSTSRRPGAARRIG